MLSDDQLGQALRHELRALGSDIHPSHGLMQRLLGDEPAIAKASVASNRPVRTAAAPRRGERPPLLGRLVGPRVAFRGLAGAFALVVAVVVAALVLTTGGGPSLVARAYAATSPQGVIFHYIQTLRFRRPAAEPQTAVTEVWSYGKQRHLILEPNKFQHFEDLAIDNGQVQRYLDGTISTNTIPANVLARGCGSIAILLDGFCERSDQNSPLAALRALYRSGRLHASGQTTANGQRVDVLTGSSNAVQVRALVDPHTSVPIEIEMTETLPLPRFGPLVVTTTITDYQRLALTPRNRELLLMRSHPHARVLRLCAAGTRCTGSRTP